MPKYRSSRVVPGVRMRLSASAPSRLTVSASLSWSRGGGGKVELTNLVTNVQHWRRVRFVIPSKLRSKLPLGLPVTLKLQIEAAPLDETLCPGKIVNKTLHLRVVKVIPGSIQAGRSAARSGQVELLRVGRVVDDVELAPRLDPPEAAGGELALDLEGDAAALGPDLERQLDHLVAGDRARCAAWRRGSSPCP